PTRRDALADFCLNGDRIPGFAYAIAVQVAEFKVGKHLRGWDDDNAHIGIGIDSTRPQPLAKQKVLRGKEEDDAKDVGFLAPDAQDFGAQGSSIANAPVPKFLRERDGIALEAEHQARNATLSLVSERVVDGEGQSGRSVSGIEFAINNLVPNGAPPNFPAQFDVDPVFLEKTKFVRH